MSSGSLLGDDEGLSMAPLSVAASETEGHVAQDVKLCYMTLLHHIMMLINLCCTKMYASSYPTCLNAKRTPPSS